jgi:hypothetical protein
MYIAAIAMRLLSLAFIALWFACTSASGQCPSITVIGPMGVTNPGDKMTFTATISRTNSRLEYSWDVSAGTIVDGQGTLAIVVATDTAMAGANVTATVDIQGLRPDCASRASESAPVAPLSEDPILDEWEGLKPNDERARLDSFFADLENNPLNTGIIVLHVNEKERFDSGNRRLKIVVKHARFREFDMNRIWFVLDRTGDRRTKLYRVPLGGDLMPCDATCLTIKGGDPQ